MQCPGIESFSFKQSDTMAAQKRIFYFMVSDWTWWAWAISAVLLWVGLLVWPPAFYIVIGLTAAQMILIMVREKSLTAFAVQLRVAFIVLLLVGLIPYMQWLFWVPAFGLLALVAFGYCLLARMMSLLPWHRTEPMSLGLIRRTFFSRPDLGRVTETQPGMSCPGGMCTIDAQVARP